MKKQFLFLFVLFSFSNLSFSSEIEEEFNKGIRLLNHRRFVEAAAAFQNVTDHDRANAAAWFFAGQSLFGAGRCQDCLNAYEEACRLQPAKEKHWVGKANCLFCLGRTDESLSAYQRAVELDNNLGFAWYGIARCYSLKVEKLAALKSLARAIELDSHYKDMAYRDRSFRNLSNETDFKKMIEP